MVDLRPLQALVTGLGGRVAGIVSMPGGASTRRYFRVSLEDGTSRVGMFVPEADKPEEITKASGSLGSARRWPFLEVRELLESRGVRVPRLLAENTKQGWLLVEDLGDETLAARLEARPTERTALYMRAVRDLSRAQAALASLPEGSVIATRAFDYDLLLWELEHFREWGLHAREHMPSAYDAAALDGVFDRLARRIAALPRAFVHRDYQSRNLMVVREELVWIDFQDALLGPIAYDLVALLHDSYQDHGDAFVRARLGDYGDAAGLSEGQRAELGREFDLIAVQRKLKDAGRFVFIDRVKHDPSFLPYVAPTLRKVARTLDRLAPNEPDMDLLRTILLRLLPEEMST